MSQRRADNFFKLSAVPLKGNILVFEYGSGPRHTIEVSEEGRVICENETRILESYEWNVKFV